MSRSALAKQPMRYLHLGDVAEITMGQSPDLGSLNTNEEGVPFLQGCAEFGSKSPLTNIYCNPALRLSKPESILISVRAPVGTLNWGDQSYCIGRGLAAIRATENTETGFLFYAIAQNVSFLHRRSQGSTFLAISGNDLKIFPVPDFDVNRQQKIARILQTIDRVIEQTEALINKYQQIKAGLMHDLFTRGIGPDGQLRPPRDQAPHLYQQTPIGWIPKEWACAKLEVYLDSNNGLKPGPFGSSLKKDSFVKSGFKVYGQEQVISGNQYLGNYYIDQNKFFSLQDFSIFENDILVSLVGTIGKVLVIRFPFEQGIINPRLMRVRPNDQKINVEFMKHLLVSNILKRQLEQLAGGGTMPVLNGRIVRSIRVPFIKSLEEQSAIATLLDAID